MIIVHDFDLECVTACRSSAHSSGSTAAAILRHLDVHALFKSKPRDRAHLPPAALGDFNRVEVLRDDVHGGGAGLSLQFSACGRYLLHRRKEKYAAELRRFVSHGRIAYRCRSSNEASLIYDLATNCSIEDALIEAQEMPQAQFGGKRLPARLMSQLWPSVRPTQSVGCLCTRVGGWMWDAEEPVLTLLSACCTTCRTQVQVAASSRSRASVAAAK